MWMSLPLVGFHGFLQESQEVLAVAGGFALAEDFTGVHEGREKVRGAVPVVVVGAFLGCVELDWQQWLDTVQRLDLGLLIQAEHDRAAGRVEIKPNDVGDLLGELRILADLERALPVRLQPGLAPQFRHIVMRHRQALGTLDELCHLTARPMRQALLHRLAGAGESQDPRTRRRRNLLPPRPTDLVEQPLDTFRVVTGRPQIHRRPRHPRQRSNLPSARHNTIRARTATVASTYAIQQIPQLGPLTHRQLPLTSQHHDQSHRCRAKRITRH